MPSCLNTPRHINAQNINLNTNSISATIDKNLLNVFGNDAF